MTCETGEELWKRRECHVSCTQRGDDSGYARFRNSDFGLSEKESEELTRALRQKNGKTEKRKGENRNVEREKFGERGKGNRRTEEKK
jgi:hypothetical protein